MHKLADQGGSEELEAEPMAPAAGLAGFTRFAGALGSVRCSLESPLLEAPVCLRVFRIAPQWWFVEAAGASYLEIGIGTNADDAVELALRGFDQDVRVALMASYRGAAPAPNPHG
jgi:hypothetical protein